VWWRRALDPDFNAEAMLAIFMDITRHMLRGRSPMSADKSRCLFDIKESVR
jgi:hypothetical protein